jgi:LmbE family N-acetylglucosaminyl deacetylase
MKSVLVIGAHPDDETMLTGGTLAFLSSQGVQVHLLCATRGEGGEMGEPPVCERPELGAVREQELRCAGQALGLASIQFLGYVDPPAGPDDQLYPFEADFNTLKREIQAAIQHVGTEVVLSHGSDGEYGHPAHQLVHRAVRAAVEDMGDSVYFYSFAARVPNIEDRIWNKHDVAHLALDIRPWLDAKEAAALCHVTQHGMFRRRHPDKAIRDVLRPIESFHRHLPAVSEIPPHDPFADLLQAAGAWTPLLMGE